MAPEPGERHRIHPERPAREPGADEPAVRRRGHRRRLPGVGERPVDLRMRTAEPGGGDDLRPLRTKPGHGVRPLQPGGGGSRRKHAGKAAGPEHPEHAGRHDPPAADPGRGIPGETDEAEAPDPDRRLPRAGHRPVRGDPFCRRAGAAAARGAPGPGQRRPRRREAGVRTPGHLRRRGSTDPRMRLGDRPVEGGRRRDPGRDGRSLRDAAGDRGQRGSRLEGGRDGSGPGTAAARPGRTDRCRGCPRPRAGRHRGPGQPDARDPHGGSEGKARGRRIRRRPRDLPRTVRPARNGGPGCRMPVPAG